MVWLTYRQAERVHGWTAVQLGTWVRETAVALALLGDGNGRFRRHPMGHARPGGQRWLLSRQNGPAAAPGRAGSRPSPSPITPSSAASSFYNHHMLYHLYLALFAQTDPALGWRPGADAAGENRHVLLAALPFLAVWWLLRGQGVRWPACGRWLCWRFLRAFSPPEYAPRPIRFLICAGGAALAANGHYRRLLPLGVVYVWLYDAFPLLLLLAGVYFVVAALTERRLLWPALLYPAAGIAIGLVINPYFPHNLTFIAHHLLAKVGGRRAVPVGSEWYPYDTWPLVQNSGLALALWLAALVWWGVVRNPYSVFRKRLTDYGTRNTDHGFKHPAHASAVNGRFRPDAPPRPPVYRILPRLRPALRGVKFGGQTRIYAAKHGWLSASSRIHPCSIPLSVGRWPGFAVFFWTARRTPKIIHKKRIL
jgi:hypothetical protein